MPVVVDCSESVEEALERLDRESKAKNAIKNAEKIKAAEKATNSTEASPEGWADGKLMETLRPEDTSKSLKLYPERTGEKRELTWFEYLWKGEGKDTIDKLKCERRVWRVLKKSHLVRIMLGALKSSGCEIDIRRHISCEACDSSVTGGYDPLLNQVVVCQNTARMEGMIQGVLTHELIHMFDYCRNKLDLQNIHHLACTEIRAANLAHCSFMGAWSYGTASPWNFVNQHRACVRKRAVDSVLAVRDVPQETAEAAVDKVFEKCYADLEPIGRRLRRSSDDIRKAYRERHIFGYL